MDVLLGLAQEHAYLKGRGPVRNKDLPHDPWFWAIPEKHEDPVQARARLVKAWEAAGGPVDASDYNTRDAPPLRKILGVGEVETVRSFVDFGQTRPAFPVYTGKSFWVPEVSDDLFGRHGFFTAEHDVPYTQRTLVDLAGGVYKNHQGKAPGALWPFDTGGEKQKLKVLVYDIETTQYGAGRKMPPVDMLGWAEFEIAYRASKDLEKEEFTFEMVDDPPDWRDVEVKQDEAATAAEEIQLLLNFVRRVPSYDVISGHNILSFDNKEVHERIENLLESDQRNQTLSKNDRRAFDEFMRKWAAKDRTFTFGQQAETVNFHPTSFDTYHAARRFYFFLDDFTLKRLAPYMGVEIPGRVYLAPTELKLGDPKTRLYNKHDVQEQLGVTGKLLAQALPLAFTVGSTFEEVLTGGNVRMWDHMGMIRAARQRKFMPATCRAQGVARSVIGELGTSPEKTTKKEIWSHARQRIRDPDAAQRLKEFLRVAKYGDEMPDFVETPTVIVNPKAVEQRNNPDASGEDEEEEEYLGYSIPGGMTLHPQQLGSHFIPWWHVVTADVGAMYPTILRALNVSADTVRLAKKGEAPDDWVWMYRLPEEFTSDPRWVVRKPGPEESYAKADQGFMIGIKKNPDAGVTALAMKGVMGIAAKVKKQLGAAKKDGKTPKVEIDRLAMMYASLKANRNAGTHGQMLAVNVSCRGFNLWAGGEITTIGQKILADVQIILKERGARVVYGDSLIGSRCVVVRDRRRRVHVLPIERLYGATGGREHRWHGKDAVEGNGWQALSLEGSAVRASCWKPIRRVIRHETAKKILRVRQVQGETICTEDHSLMAERKGKIRRTRPEELEGATLVRVRVPPNARPEVIDLVEYLEPLARRLEHAMGPPRRGGRINNVQRWGYDEERIWFSTIRADANGRLRRGLLKRFIRPGSPESAALCRVMGAYAAEGSVNWGPRQGASIASADVPWLQNLRADLAMLFEGFDIGIVASSPGLRTIQLQDGTSSTYADETHKIQMTNKLAALFFWALGGKTSAGKKVPSVVFNLGPADQRHFLDKALDGDGSYSNDRRYTPEHRARHFSYTTKSVELASGMAALLSQLGYDYGMRHNVRKGTHVLFTRDSKKPDDRTIVEPWSHDGPVYDLEVEGTHTFVDAYGPILVHNTDGLYIGCSKSGKNFPEVAEALGVEYAPGPPDSFYILPDDAEEAIREANDRIRKFLNYDAFELEAEHHDAMVFVVHKNYLIFDVKKGKLEMLTKGNNFRGSDKAPLAQRLLAEIMRDSLRETIEWSKEEDAREALKGAIKKYTREFLKTFDVTRVDKSELTLVQVVQPIGSYKPNPDGTPSIWIKRAQALEKVTGDKLRASKKYRFVVCKKPLPGIEKPTKTGIKPLDYMWPLDNIQSEADIDLAWYKDMIEKYVRGAFGFEDLELHTQRGLGAWM